MALLAVCIAQAAVALASASQVESQGVLRHSKHSKHDADSADGFVRTLEFKHRLRICNAYPYGAAMDVYRGKSEKLTGETPMPYKTCRDFLAPLKAGDKLEFKVGDANAGTFSVSDLPNNDAVLFLVIHRHDTLSTAVSFESHVFANLLNAQVAIIDTFKGSSTVMPRIMDAKSVGKQSRSEELRFNSVVAVNPGVYEVELVGKDGEVRGRHELVALNRESYVVLRTGVEAQQGESYSQDIVVYPNSDPSTLKSGTVAAGPAAAVLALAIAAIALLF
mmetsp:Transcript_113969/g.333063  ORF Transcript_113969/g.333063 Transcript_113969/m.333063 type:complete len:277 (+) Transcript_113969:74-904(+)